MLRLAVICLTGLVALASSAVLAQEKSKTPGKPNRISNALQYERRRDLAGALKLLNEEIADNPKNAAAYFHRGRLSFNDGQFLPELKPQIESDLGRALELHASDATWWKLRADFHARTGAEDKAVDDLTTALKIKPDRPEWLLQRGLAYARIDKLKEAAGDNEAAAKLKPDYAFAWINATDVYVRLGDGESAVRTGEQAVKVAAGIPMAQLNCGRAYLLANRFDAAEERLSQALALVPNFPQAYFYRANLNSLLGNPFAARNDYYLCTVLNPADLQSHRLYAAAERECGNYEAAVERGQELCQHDPNHAQYQLELAYSWAGFEEVAKASAALNNAGMDKELLAEVERLRGDLLWQQGDLVAARKAYEAALEEHDRRVNAAPNDMRVRRARANFLSNQHQGARALADLRAVLDQSPRNFDAGNALAWLYATTSDAKLRNPEEAVRLSGEASKLMLDKNHSFLDTKAAAHAAAGDFEEAVRLQSRAIELAPPHDAAKYRPRLLAFRNRQPWTESADIPKFGVSIRPEPMDSSIKPKLFEATRLPESPLEERRLTEVIEMARHAVVLLEHDYGGGSGMIVSSEGHVLTCAHVLPARGVLTITLERTVDGKPASSTHRAEILAVDHVRDLALVKMLDAKGLPTVRLGLKTTITAGDNVVAIGNPLAGGDGVLRHVATDGIVSNAAQLIGTHKRQERIQTTAVVSPGSSGGPLLNMRGEVVGVIASKIAAAQAGFAIPMSDILKFLELADQQ